MAQQSDAEYMANLARQRHALMEDHAWDLEHYAETGEWVLKRVLQNVSPPRAA